MQQHDDTLAAFVAQESTRDDAVVYLVGTEERFRAAWALLREPTAATGGAYADAPERLHDWGGTPDETLSRFVRDNELAWLTGRVPPEFS